MPKVLPAVEIFIPTRDKLHLLKECIDSVIRTNNYQYVKITVIDNDSELPETHEYLSQLRKKGISIKTYSGRFNFSAICNQAVATSSADYVLFLNNDVKALSDDWLSSMVSHAVSESSPIVGKRLLYPNGEIQHAGVALGLNGIVDHAKIKTPVDVNGIDCVCYRVSAVTFACALVRRSLYLKLGGLDEMFKVGLNDIDFCLRAEKIGIPIVVCGEGDMLHHESATRPSAFSVRGFIRAALETSRFYKKWRARVMKDGYFDYQ